MITFELKLGDSSVKLSADVQDLKDLKPEVKRFIDTIMAHGEVLQPVLQHLIESIVLSKNESTKIPVS